MPLKVSEITSGAGFGAEDNDGQFSSTAVRVFRIILSQPGETIEPQATCGVSIGSAYPLDTSKFCISYDARFEGDSRTVLLVTFQYRTPEQKDSGGGGGNENPKDQPPDVRSANWSTSSSLIEVPKRTWKKVVRFIADRDDVAAANPVGDMYDDVMVQVPVINITVTQWDSSPPIGKLEYVGYININTIYLRRGGAELRMVAGTLMFRNVSIEPAVESWRGVQYRGWISKYEFIYKANSQSYNDQVAPHERLSDDCGWDILQPVTGFNIIAFDPNNARADQDINALPLRHGEKDSEFSGMIVPPPEGYALAEGIVANKKVRANVRVASYENKGFSQVPSAQPVALNGDGTPRLTHDDDGKLIRDPLVFRYRVQPSGDLNAMLRLRLD